MKNSISELSEQVVNAQRFGTSKYQYEICRTCKNQRQNLEMGVYCELTNKKPDFYESCDKYDIDIEKKNRQNKNIKEKKENQGFAREALIALLLGIFALIKLVFLSSNGFDIVSIILIIVSISWLVLAGISASKIKK